MPEMADDCINKSILFYYATVSSEIFTRVLFLHAKLLENIILVK